MYCLSHTSSLFYSGYIGDGELLNYVPQLAFNHYPPILASQVARITGVSTGDLPKRRIFVAISSH
jgi:hypothetical protein